MPDDLSAYFERARMPEGHPLRALIEEVVRVGGEAKAAAQAFEQAKGQRVTREDLGELCRQAATGASERAGELARAHSARTIVLALCILAMTAVMGAAGGYVAAPRIAPVAGLEAGQRTCSEVNGGTLCWIPVWEKMPHSR